MSILGCVTVIWFSPRVGFWKLSSSPSIASSISPLAVRFWSNAAALSLAAFMCSWALRAA